MTADDDGQDGHKHFLLGQEREEGKRRATNIRDGPTRGEGGSNGPPGVLLCRKRNRQGGGTGLVVMVVYNNDGTGRWRLPAHPPVVTADSCITNFPD